jgi:hypothetical protein
VHLFTMTLSSPWMDYRKIRSPSLEWASLHSEYQAMGKVQNPCHHKQQNCASEVSSSDLRIIVRVLTKILCSFLTASKHMLT